MKNHIPEILTFLATMAGFILTAYINYLKIKNENRKLLGAIADVIKELAYLKNEMNYLKEDSDNRKARHALEIQLQTIGATLIHSKLVRNEEFKRLIDTCCSESFLRIIRPIFISEFKGNTKAILKNRFILVARTIQKKIDYEKLFVIRFDSIDKDESLNDRDKKRKKRNITDGFYQSAKINVVLPSMELFIEGYIELAQLENGVRRGEFEKLTVDVVTTLIEQMVAKYQQYAK